MEAYYTCSYTQYTHWTKNPDFAHCAVAAWLWAWHNCAPGTRGHNHPSSPTIPRGPEQQRSKCEREISIRHQEHCRVSIKQIAAITTLVPSIVPIHNLGWGLAGQLSALWSDSAL